MFLFLKVKLRFQRLVLLHLAEAVCHSPLFDEGNNELPILKPEKRYECNNGTIRWLGFKFVFLKGVLLESH